MCCNNYRICMASIVLHIDKGYQWLQASLVSMHTQYLVAFWKVTVNKNSCNCMLCKQYSMYGLCFRIKWIQRRVSRSPKEPHHLLSKLEWIIMLTFAVCAKPTLSSSVINFECDLQSHSMITEMSVCHTTNGCGGGGGNNNLPLPKMRVPCPPQA